MKTAIHHTAILILFICIIFIAYNSWHNNPPLKRKCKSFGFQTKESSLAHLILDNLTGIEIGGAVHNPFCLNTINIDFTNESSTRYKQYEKKFSGGTYLEVDVAAPGDKLPFLNESYDFVISSHTIEHFYDPIKTIEEWLRVTKKGGYVFMIIPHKERTYDRFKNRTTLNELILRHKNPDPKLINSDSHHNIWITEDVIELCKYQKWKIYATLDTDDKAENGFTIVIQKT
uniref:Methyltransferase type 11 domain-containing protein n=1 Tax=Panagrolaimus sp. PS1159 TaxID=55785 RepID=A0AC35GFL0_9BILA